MYTSAVLALLLLLLSLYLFHVHRAMSGIPDEALKISPHRFTKDEIRETYKRIEEKPIDFTPLLPPKLDRRYIVVGGSGLVGGQIVLQLLARKQSPKSIRIIDFRVPIRADLLEGKAKEVPFVQADISSKMSTRNAFNESWPDDVSTLPLTVFHTAAVINSYERHPSLLPRCSLVNTTGTANVLAASQSAGADIFVATSSGSVAVFPVNFWTPPWRSQPSGYIQVYAEEDQGQPLRSHEEYFNNYAVAKAAGERLVLKANSKTFRTGTIRPANGIYGNQYDQTSGNYLNRGIVPTWIPHIIQNFVSAGNVALSHLLFEKALLNKRSTIGGKAFVVTDPNPPVMFGDLYQTLETLSVTPFKANPVPGIFLLILAYPIEQYHILQSKFPNYLPELGQDIKMVQPALFSITSHLVASDAAAQKSVEAGGLAYHGAHTTLEGLCMQVKRWNDEHPSKREQTVETAIEATEMEMEETETELKNIGAVAGKPSS